MARSRTACAPLIPGPGNAFAIHEGIEQIRHTEPIRDAWVNFTVPPVGVATVLARETRSLLIGEARRRLP